MTLPVSPHVKYPLIGAAVLIAIVVGAKALCLAGIGGAGL